MAREIVGIVLLMMVLCGCSQNSSRSSDPADAALIILPETPIDPTFYPTGYGDMSRRPPLKEHFGAGETPAVYVEETDRRTVTVELVDLGTGMTLEVNTDYTFRGNWMIFPFLYLPAGDYLAVLSVGGAFRAKCNFSVEEQAAHLDRVDDFSVEEQAARLDTVDDAIEQ